jgi:DNA mismatch repair protein MutS
MGVFRVGWVEQISSAWEACVRNLVVLLKGPDDIGGPRLEEEGGHRCIRKHAVERCGRPAQNSRGDEPIEGDPNTHFGRNWNGGACRALTKRCPTLCLEVQQAMEFAFKRRSADDSSKPFLTERRNVSVSIRNRRNGLAVNARSGRVGLDELSQHPQSFVRHRRGSGESQPPVCFADLNLDQIVATITAGKRDYNLAPFFHRSLKSSEAIGYRQEVMRDLEDNARCEAVVKFAAAMKSVGEHLAEAGKLHYKYQKEAWLLDGVEIYCRGVRSLLAELGAASPRSPGLVGFLTFLDEYVGSSAFEQLSNEIATLKARLSSIRYTLLIGDSVITVSACHGEPDYGAEILADFERFKQGAAKDHIFKFADFEQMNHIEAGVLDRVARLNPAAFAELDNFSARSKSFFDPTVLRFDREVQFYVAYVSHIGDIGRAGLMFCYPRVSRESKEIRAKGAYDLALAKMLVDKQSPVVTNDFFLEGRERIIIVSGPNQGGKTTFARTFGLMHHLASIGCPVPGTEAQLFLFDQMFTHFEREEDVHNLRGKLYDDLHRLHNTLSAATSDSTIILNEVFSSTSLKDAIFLSANILTKIIELDALCVCVTFIDELAGLSDTSVSMASTVNPNSVAERTFKVVRRPPDGLAYAISIAEKYGLTYRQLRDRLPS